MSTVWSWMERRVSIAWALTGVSVVALAAAAGPVLMLAWMDYRDQDRRATERVRAALEEANERATPIVTMSGRLVSRTPTGVVLHIAGEKHRACEYRGLQAFSVDSHGAQHDAFITRADIPETGQTKPPGQYDIGRWYITPVVRDALAVRVYVTHRCGQIAVTTMIADVPLAVSAP